MGGFRDLFFHYLGRFFLWINGWKSSSVMPPDLKQCVMIAAPHTTNWDLPYTLAAFGVFRIPVRFTIKKEWLKPPFGFLMRFLGAIGIDRRPKSARGEKISFTEAMARLFDENEHLAVLVTPEGTRSYVEQWKTGFYYVAKMANVPIALGFLDYKEKHAGVGKIVYTTDDMEADLRKIMEFYSTKGAKFPEKFSIDKRYSP